MSATVKLQAGSIDLAGTLTAGSLADVIDKKLAAMVPYGPNEDVHGRRTLLLGIAQGIVEYLKTHEHAFMVTVPDGFGKGGTVDAEIRIDV